MHAMYGTNVAFLVQTRAFLSTFYRALAAFLVTASSLSQGTVEENNFWDGQASPKETQESIDRGYVRA